MNRRAPVLLVADKHISTVAEFLRPEERILLFNEEPKSIMPAVLDHASSFTVEVKIASHRGKLVRRLPWTLAKAVKLKQKT